MTLFDVDVPTGFQYRDDFITRDEEAALAEEIARLEFSTFEMRGVVARRRVAFFGRSYDAGGAVAAAAGISDAAARPGGAVGEHGAGRIRDGADQGVPAGRADRLAPRRAPVRHRRRHLAAVVLSDEVSPVRPARRDRRRGRGGPPLTRSRSSGDRRT